MFPNTSIVTCSTTELARYGQGIRTPDNVVSPVYGASPFRPAYRKRSSAAPQGRQALCIGENKLYLRL